MRTHGPKLSLRNMMQTPRPLLQGLNDNDISMAIHCSCAFDIWQVLIITHKGTSQVKKAKIDLLNSQSTDFICLMMNL